MTPKLKTRTIDTLIHRGQLGMTTSMVWSHLRNTFPGYKGKLSPSDVETILSQLLKEEEISSYNQNWYPNTKAASKALNDAKERYSMSRRTGMVTVRLLEVLTSVIGDGYNGEETISDDIECIMSGHRDVTVTLDTIFAERLVAALSDVQ